MASRDQVIGVFNRAVLRWPDAVSEVVFKQDGVYDYDSDSIIGGTTTPIKDALKITFSRRDIDGTNVMTGDYQIMIRVDDLPHDPTSAAKVTYKGKNVIIENVETDPADAVYTIHVRPS